jgi:ubiquitin carboxyl-terminal hydrolase MINDY-3/4
VLFGVSLGGYVLWGACRRIVGCIHLSSVWGLTQEHGGPCGVLAAIQSELLRLLLFGERTTHPLSMIPLQIPNDLEQKEDTSQQQQEQQHEDGNTTTINTSTPQYLNLTPLLLQQALALSMGIILARAAMVPSASDEQQHQVETNRESHIRSPTARIVLPQPNLWNGTISNLQWQHFDPWYPPAKTPSESDVNTISDYLVTYTISIGGCNYHPTTTAAAAVTAASSDTIQQEDQLSKRQKRDADIPFANSGDHDMDAVRTNSTVTEDTITDDENNNVNMDELAHAIAQFLLETNALSWFQRPGGVLLFLLNLVQTRTLPIIQSDMDDPTNKVTSNFGHCSQELINLLLTGQSGERKREYCVYDVYFVLLLFFWDWFMV